ncbi:MAG: TniB family NTP-binding protein [Propionivibrio sp.]
MLFNNSQYGDVGGQRALADELTVVANVRVEHPTWLEARDEIIDLHSLRTARQEGSGVLITGESGAGKTALLRSIEAMFPRSTTPDRTLIRCLFVTIPPRPTIKSAAQSVLHAQGDPLAFVKGQSVVELTERIIALLKGCGTELILLDEVAHIIAGRRNDSLYSVADWLKHLADASHAPLVLAGLPKAEEIVQGNEQLRRRFSASVMLEVARLDESLPDLTTFRAVVREIEQHLPIPSAMPLHSKDIARRLLYATEGRIGYIMMVIERAIRICRRSAQNSIDADVLASAFQRAVWKGAIGAKNPFHKDFSWKRLIRCGEPFAPPLINVQRRGRR